jgi:hypothetical protein
MYLHKNPRPIWIQTCGNKTYDMLNETIDDEPVCVLQILTAKKEKLSSSDY